MNMTSLGESILIQKDIQAGKSEGEMGIFIKNRYYFTVKNMKKGQRVKFNLVNLSKKDSLYQRVFDE